MKVIFMIIVAYLAAGFFDIPPLWENARKKEMKIYLLMMVLSLGLSIFLGLGIKYESIASKIENLLSIFINI